MSTLLVPSQLFQNQIYYEFSKHGSKKYGIRIEHIDGNSVTLAIVRPDGYVDWSLRYTSNVDRTSRIMYDEPDALPWKIKNRVARLYEIFSDRSIVMKLLRELKDKYVVLSDSGSPATVAKTPYNLLRFERMKGGQIHTRSQDGYSVDQTTESEHDEALVITSPEGIAVPLLSGKFELALNLLAGKPIGDVLKKNYDLIINSLSSEKEAK